jgi:polyadenylate-binding protein 2
MAYVEFENKDAVQNALILDGTEHKGRKIRVVQKRTNVPAHQLRGRGRGRGDARGGRGGRGRGGGFVPMMMPAFMAAGLGGGMMMYAPRGSWRGAPRGRGGPRGRGRGSG